MDTVKITLPLFIRLMEYAKEDAKTDMDLHFIAEYLSKHEHQCFTMSDYKSIIKYVEKGSASQ